MTSERKIRANRANAKFSTGPRSALGLRHSSQNARRHGLSRPPIMYADMPLNVEQLGKALAGPTNDFVLLAAAENVAEAQIELDRVFAAKQSAVSEAAKIAVLPVTIDQSQRLDSLLTLLTRINRYENRASARRRKAIKALDAKRAAQFISRPVWQNEAKNFNENKEAK